MKSKEKVKGVDTHSRGSARPKTLMVAEGSLQTRAPGYVMPGGLETPFPRGNTGSMRSDGVSRGQRAGATIQSSGWSARQQAQRMQARGEQDRLGSSRQSGNGNAQGGYPDQSISPSGLTRKR
jgi:hypothetical protein